MEEQNDLLACVRCSRPVEAADDYCSHCRAPVSPMTTLVPYIDIEAQADFLTRALFAVGRGPGLGLRTVCILIALAMPGSTLIALLALGLRRVFRG